MKTFLLVVLSSLFVLRCTCQDQYDALDSASAKDVSGFVPDNILMDVVHSLTPQARKGIRTLRRSIEFQEKLLKAALRNMDRAADRQATRKNHLLKAVLVAENHQSCVKRKQKKCGKWFKGRKCLSKACGNRRRIEYDLKEAQDQFKKAKKKHQKAVLQYEFTLKFLEKLKKALKRLLRDDGPKPSVEPRA